MTTACAYLIDRMDHIFAPEFRGSIGRRLALPSLGAGSVILSLILSAIVFSGDYSEPSFAAEKPRLFSQTPSADCAAMFTLPDLDGRERTLAAQRGRPVIVHFFATWCEPCKAEFGTLQQFFQARGDKIGVVAVNVGEVPGRVRSFLEETPVSFPVLLDADRSVTKAWAVEGLPATVVLDNSLKPILAVTGDLNWASADVGSEIEQALASDPNPRGDDCTKEYER